MEDIEFLKLWNAEITYIERLLSNEYTRWYIESKDDTLKIMEDWNKKSNS